MNLQPIKMTRWEARDTIAQYRALLKERRTAEDVAIMRSAKAILRGAQVIRLADAIRAGGMDAQFRPRIAVAHADDRFVQVERWHGGLQMAGAPNRGQYIADYRGPRGSWHQLMTQSKPRAFRFNLDGGPTERRVKAETIVPSIPPAHRPLETELDRFYILFEAE